jgi:hypothetical protein
MTKEPPSTPPRNDRDTCSASVVALQPAELVKPSARQGLEALANALQVEGTGMRPRKMTGMLLSESTRNNSVDSTGSESTHAPGEVVDTHTRPLAACCEQKVMLLSGGSADGVLESRDSRSCLDTEQHSSMAEERGGEGGGKAVERAGKEAEARKGFREERWLVARGERDCKSFFESIHFQICAPFSSLFI